MSRQKYQINQLVRVTQNTRYDNPRGFGIVQDYKPGTYAGYRVMMFCTHKVSGSRYNYYGQVPYDQDKILQCRANELNIVYNDHWNSNVEDVQVMRSSVTTLVKDAIASKENNLRYGWGAAGYDALIKRMAWLSFSNKRIETMETYPGKNGACMIRTNTFYNFPLEREIDRSEYVY